MNTHRLLDSEAVTVKLEVDPRCQVMVDDGIRSADAQQDIYFLACLFGNLLQKAANRHNPSCTFNLITARTRRE
jgi:hypothetical protein